MAVLVITRRLQLLPCHLCVINIGAEIQESAAITISSQST
jgi:hypothetical protein